LLLRLIGTIITLAGLLIVVAVTAFLLLAWFTGGVPFVSNMQLGVSAVSILVGALFLAAAGQFLHLLVGIWRALGAPELPADREAVHGFRPFPSRGGLASDDSVEQVRSQESI